MRRARGRMLHTVEKADAQLPRAFCARVTITVCAVVTACVFAAQIAVLPSVLQEFHADSDLVPLSVVCVSDTHGRHDELRLLEGDVLIIAGDFLPANADEEWLKDFNNWLGARRYTYKILVPGNMDYWIAQHQERAKELLTNALLLIDESEDITVRGHRYSVYGSPWTPELAGVYQMPANSLLDAAVIWQKIPQQLDILITHGPPHGTLDVTSYGRNIGDNILAQAIEHARPRLHVFGHARHSAGRLKKVGITYVNAAQFDASLSGPNLPIVAELPVMVRRKLRAVPKRNTAAMLNAVKHAERIRSAQ